MPHCPPIYHSLFECIGTKCLLTNQSNYHTNGSKEPRPMGLKWSLAMSQKRVHQIYKLANGLGHTIWCVTLRPIPPWSYDPILTALVSKGNVVLNVKLDVWNSNHTGGGGLAGLHPPPPPSVVGATHPGRMGQHPKEPRLAGCRALVVPNDTKDPQLIWCIRVGM